MYISLIRDWVRAAIRRKKEIDRDIDKKIGEI